MRRVFSLLLPMLIVSFFIGCGSGGGGVSSTTGRATTSVIWPPPARLVPLASNSIIITIKRGTTVVSNKLLTRIAAGGEATVSFEDLPTGNLTATAIAYPDVNGLGVVQATATIPFVVRANQSTAFTINMVSKIDRLEVAPASPVRTIGDIVQFTSLAKNTTGNVVLVAPSKMLWSSSNPLVASIDNTGKATVVGAGETTITVTDSESGKSISTVLTAIALVDDFNDNSTNTTLWNPVVLGTGPSVAEATQRLQVTLPASSAHSVEFGAGYQSRFSVRGDFDIEVGYRLVTWPTANGVRLGIVLNGGGTNNLVTAHRVSLNVGEFIGEVRQSHTATFIPLGGGAEDYLRSGTAQSVGRLRIVRTGGTFAAYYLNASSAWILLKSGGAFSGDVTLALKAWSSDGAFANNLVQIAFDDFRVSKGQVILP